MLEIKQESTVWMAIINFASITQTKKMNESSLSERKMCLTLLNIIISETTLYDFSHACDAITALSNYWSSAQSSVIEGAHLLQGLHSSHVKQRLNLKILNRILIKKSGQLLRPILGLIKQLTPQLLAGHYRASLKFLK